MNSIEPKILKGFRDFLPIEAKKRQYVINTLKKVFESYGFEPLETPALEYEEILTGKYGEEGDKLMYRFEDNGKRKVALRYDQTVPLARVVAQYQNELPMPFKRYQIQNVWRAENTQKGRFREFLQCDADIVGSSSPLADAEIISLSSECLEKLGFKNFKILVNDREVFKNPKSFFKTSFDFPIEKTPYVIRTFDKYRKIGKEGVRKELSEIGFTTQESDELVKNIDQEISLTTELENIKLKLDENVKSRIKPISLARGLDYYTGLIFEIEIEGYLGGSVAGGGRYDNLIGIFAGKQIPAVGFAFGFDRLMEAMDELSLFPADLSMTKALVTIFSEELKGKSSKLAQMLRDENINTELYLEDTKMEKQLKYADKKQIPYVVIIGPDEARNETVTLRNMQTRKQEIVTQKDLPGKLV